MSLWIIIIGVLLVALVGGVLLYSNARVQQYLLNKQPNYSAQDLYTHSLQLTNQGDYQQAEQYLKEALLKEDDATYRNQLAVVEYRLHKYKEAIDEYKKLLAAKTDESFAWNGIGNAYRDWADQEKSSHDAYQGEAVKAYQQCLNGNDHYVACYSNLAILWHSQGNTTGAKDLVNQGISKTGSPQLQSLLTTLNAD